MSSRVVHLIVIHCSASANGVSLATVVDRAQRDRKIGKSAAEVIDGWHAARGFQRAPIWRQHFPRLQHIGYHRVIDVDGTVEIGRDFEEHGAHAVGHNYNSLGFCVVGRDKFTLDAWSALHAEVVSALELYPNARVCGHRDLSPDKDGDGVVEKNEWLKTCPGFDATTWWLLKNLEPMQGHILESPIRRIEA